MTNYALTFPGGVISDPTFQVLPDLQDALVDNGTLELFDFGDPISALGSTVAVGQNIPSILLATTINPGVPVNNNGTVPLTVSGNGIGFTSATSGEKLSLSGAAAIIPSGALAFGAGIWIKPGSLPVADTYEAIFTMMNGFSALTFAINYTVSTAKWQAGAQNTYFDVAALTVGAITQLAVTAVLSGTNTWTIQAYQNGVPVGASHAATLTGVEQAAVSPQIGSAASGATANMNFTAYRGWIERFDQCQYYTTQGMTLTAAAAAFVAADWAQNNGRTLYPFS